MFAVLEAGGKQYKVEAGDVIKIERIQGDIGSEVKLDKVLATSKGIGSPLVSGAVVTAEVLDQRKNEKVIIFKKKRRHNYRRKRGHRQEITVLRIKDIVA